MKNIKYKLATSAIILIVIIQLIIMPEIIGFGAANSGWDTTFSGCFGGYPAYDFTSRENGVILLLILLLIIGLLYFLFRIYKAISKKEANNK